MTHADITLLSIEDVCRLLGIEERRLKQLIRDRVLIDGRDASGTRGVPQELLVKGANGWEPLPFLQGTLTLLADDGFTPEESLSWLYEVQDELGARPIGEVDAEDGTPLLPQCRGIAEGLGPLEFGEAVPAAGDEEFGARVRRDLEEHPVGVSALVVLTGRMQVPGTEPERRLHTRMTGDQRPQISRTGLAEAVEANESGDAVSPALSIVEAKGEGAIVEPEGPLEAALPV